MSNPANEVRHLSGYELKALKEGSIPESELLSISMHLSDCGSCAGRFAACFEEDELLEVPKGFRENILHRLQPAQNNRKQLLFYSIRVAVAACLTLVFVFSGGLNIIERMDSKIGKQDIKGLYVADTVNEGLYNFSQKLLNMEVFLNENEKK